MRKGYARETLEAAEKRADELGTGRIENCTSSGTTGQPEAPYEVSGYSPTSIVTSRRLGGR